MPIGIQAVQALMAEMLFKPKVSAWECGGSASDAVSHLPATNFGIGTVDGRDYYELFGELATSSRLDTVIIELRTLAENAIDAATDLRHAQIPAA